MGNSSIRLVTRGDDAGMCHTANVAIRDAAMRGILRNVSVMVPAPAFDKAVEIFSAMHGVTLGLHVDLTAEWEHVRWGSVLPQGEVPTLVDTHGYFYQSWDGLINRGAYLEQMQSEVRVQLNKARGAGLDIQYLDEHMDVGRINGLGEWLIEFCAQQDLIFDRALRQQGKLQNLPRSDGRNDVENILLDSENALPGTYLLVGQAAYLPGQTPGIEVQNRDWQRRMFMEDSVLAYCRENNVIPISYTDV